MDNTIIFGIMGLLLLLFITCLIMWLMGRKKITAIKEALNSLSDEKITLNGNLAVLTEKCSKIEPMEQEIGKYRKKQDEMHAEIIELSANLATEVEKAKNNKRENNDLQEKIGTLRKELAAEVEKSKKLEEISDELAKNKSIIDELRTTINQDKTTMAGLESQSQESQEKAEEQSDIINRIKKLFV